MATSGAVLTELPGLAAALPSPSAALDPYLDAAATCFVRHGIGRTSVQDIARELRVDRTTVYRQVGNVPAIVRLLTARELHRLLGSLPVHLTGLRGPEVVVDLLVTVIEFGRQHPVLTKVLSDEPELVGPYLIQEGPAFIDLVAVAVAPLLRVAMEAGELARRDPDLVTQLLVRLCLPLLLAPPPGDLRALLAEVLVPALSPEVPR